MLRFEVLVGKLAADFRGPASGGVEEAKERAIAEVNDLHPDLVVCCGDLTTFGYKPEFAEAQANLGSALQGMNQVDEAIVCYRRALEMKPDLAAACINLGTALHAQGKHEAAIAEFDRAIAIDPRDIAVSRALPTGGAAPAHSLMLTPDLKTAWVNVAGGDYLAVIDLASGEVTDEVATGKFP